MSQPNFLQRGLQRVLGIRAQTLTLDDVAGWQQLMAVATSKTGHNVTQDTALRLSTVWACVRLISETLATLPLGMYERDGGRRRPAPGHWLHGIIHDTPNSKATAAVFWESVTAAMLLRGEAYAEKLVIGDRITGLRFLVPSRLRRPWNRQSDVFEYTERDGTTREIPAKRIWTVPGFSLDGQHGTSVIAYGAEVFGAALAANEAAASTFKNGLMPSTYFKMDRVLTPAQRAEFRENLAALTGSLNAGKSPLLEGGMTVGEVGIKPEDAQLLESRGFSVEEICRWFRVPPFMVGHTEKATSWGSGIEQQLIGFLTFTLAPWVRRIEQAISKDLLTPIERQRYYPKFSVEGLLRADSAGRAAYYGVMVDKGIFTRDQVRELEDQEPMGGNAAVLTVQAATVPLDDLGKTESTQ